LLINSIDEAEMNGAITLCFVQGYGEIVAATNKEEHSRSDWHDSLAG